MGDFLLADPPPPEVFSLVAVGDRNDIDVDKLESGPGDLKAVAEGVRLVLARPSKSNCVVLNLGKSNATFQPSTCSTRPQDFQYHTIIHLTILQ
jgi:hypothetical protein